MIRERSGCQGGDLVDVDVVRLWCESGRSTFHESLLRPQLDRLDDEKLERSMRRSCLEPTSICVILYDFFPDTGRRARQEEGQSRSEC